MNLNFKTFISTYQKKQVTEFPNKCNDYDPLVTVCVLTYNHANFIKQCLDGILIQKTKFHYEIYLGEDESTDGTREICIEYAQKYPDKIRLILHSRANNILIHGNPSGRFNTIYALLTVRGKYITFCEGDDYWTDPLKLQKQVDFLESNPSYSGTFHETKILNASSGKFTGKYGANASEDISAEDTFSQWSLFHTSSFIFRRSSIVIPYWFINIISGDMALFSIVASSGLLKKIPGIMSVYRKHESGYTETNAIKDNFNQDRIKLMNWLNEFHDFKYEAKSKIIISLHQQAIETIQKSEKIMSDIKEKRGISLIHRVRNFLTKN